MHVGLVIDAADDRREAAPDTAELVDELARRGVRVTVLAVGEPPGGEGESAGPPGAIPVSWNADAAALESAVRRAAGEAGVDLLHSLGPLVACDLFQPRAGTVAERQARQQAVPRNWSARMRVKLRMRFDRDERSALLAERAFLARPSRPMIVANSRYTARQLWHHYGIEDRLHTVLGGVVGPTGGAAELAEGRRAVRLRLELSPETRLLVLSASDLAWAGAGYLIEAIHRAEGRGRLGPMALALLSADDAGPYQSQAAALDLSARVFAIAPPDGRERWAWLAAADVAVLPTGGAACSRFPLEALSAGTPVVTTEHEGAGKLVDETAAGEVVHMAWAIDELAGAVAHAADPARRAAWAEAAAGLAERVSIGRMADELMVVYQNLAGQAGSSRNE
ncbi:MAG: D-inositol-3-phosphate glycosyltransferase [Phycisphaerae bacterium]|nr:D-inositol-3-phosphate glycosyltransferase [Phycisphaerae bacterium]